VDVIIHEGLARPSTAADDNIRSEHYLLHRSWFDRLTTNGGNYVRPELVEGSVLFVGADNFQPLLILPEDP